MDSKRNEFDVIIIGGGITGAGEHDSQAYRGALCR